MNKKIMPLVLLGLLTVGTLVGCNNDETTTTTPTPTPTTPVTPDPTTPEATTPEVTTPAVVHVESVDLECDALTLYVGDTANLTVTVLPENADDKTYTLDASSEAVTIEGLTVTAASVGTATITVTTNDGAKTDSVNISVLEALPPEPEYKTIPFADETQLEEKVLSYWAEVETVEAETTDWEDGTYEIIYTATDASWVDLQLLYKNSDLIEGQCYLLEWNLFSDVAGYITVNGKTVTIAEGDNEIVIKYVCGTDTSATTGLQVFFGTAEYGLLQGEFLGFELPTWTETTLHTYESENWSVVPTNDGFGNEAVDGDYWWFDDEPTVVSKGNPSMRMNVLANNTPVDKNYDISVYAQGTSDSPTLYSEHVGILAWYHDENNYVVCYGDWEKDLNREMRQFQTAAIINGGDPIWGDFWTDQAYWAPFQYPLSQKSLYEVQVRTSGTKLSVSLTINENLIGNKSYDISHIVEGENKAGLYAYGDDTITFSEYTYTRVDVQEEEPELKSKYTYVKEGGVPASITDNEDGTYEINAPTSWEGNFFVKESAAAIGEFTISSKFTAEVGYPNDAERMYGLVFYWDEANFITVYSQYVANRAERMNCINVVGFVGGHDAAHWTGFHTYWMCEDWHLAGQGVSANPAEGFTLSVEYSNGIFKPAVDGVSLASYDSTGAGGWTELCDLATRFPSDIWTQECKVGYFVSAGNNNLVTATDINVVNKKPVPVAHSYSLVKEGGVPASITDNEDGTYAINAPTSWEGNFLVTEDLNAVGKFTISSEFTAEVGYPNDAERMYGLVLYWDDANFITVYSQYVANRAERMNCINVVGFVGGHDAAHWTGFHTYWMCEDWHLAGQGVSANPAEGFTLSVEYNNGIFKPAVDGVSLDSYDSTGSGGWSFYCDLASRFPSDIWTKECKIGYFVSAGNNNLVTVSDIAITK